MTPVIAMEYEINQTVCLVDALLGLVSQNMRAVSIEFASHVIILNFLLENDLEETWSNIEDIVDDFDALQEGYVDICKNIIISSKMMSEQKFPGRWVFARKILPDLNSIKIPTVLNKHLIIHSPDQRILTGWQKFDSEAKRSLVGIEYENYQVTCLVQSLLNLVAENLRVVSIEFTSNTVILNFLLEKDLEESQRDIEGIVVKFKALQSHQVDIRENVIVDSREIFEIGFSGRMVYARKEYFES